MNADYEFIDETGNVNIAVGWAYLQLGSPYLQVVHPEDGATVEGTYPIDVYVEAVEPAVIDSVQYQVEGEATWTHLTRVNNTYWWVANWNTTVYTDGTYELRIRAIDSEGIEVVQILSIIINNAGAPANAPIVSLTTPADGDIISGITAIQWNSTPQGGASLVGADSVQIDGGAGSYSWNTTAEVDGSHIFRVKSIDNINRVGYSDTRLILVDNTSPKVEDISFGYPGGQTAVKVGDNVIISAYVTDNISGVSSVILDGTNLNGVAANAMLDNGVAPDEYANDNVYTVQITITNGATGTVTYDINATDNEGNTVTVTRNAVLDNIPPTITDIFVLDPDAYYRDGEIVCLRAQCAGEAGLRLSGDFINIDNSYITGAEDVVDIGGGNYDITYTISETNQRADGSYNILVTAYDGALNSATSGIILDLDNTPPLVTTEPSLDDVDDILNADDVVRATISDGGHNIAAAEYFVDVIGMPGEGASMNATDGAFDELTEDVNANFLIAGLTEGDHTVYVRGQDVVGNWGAPSELGFKVDREGPVIQNVEVQYPDNQTAVKDGDQIVITALITDKVTSVDPATVNLDGTNLNGLAVNQMYDDGTNGDEVANDDIYTAVVTISTGLNGAQTFTVYAYDIVPNGSSIQGSVILDNTPPVWISSSCGDADRIYKNEDQITIVTKWDGIDYLITADFSELDMYYEMGSENVVNNGDSTYTISYTITFNNTISDSESIMIPITAYDGVGNGPVTDSSYLVELDNTAPDFDSIDTDRDNYMDGDSIIMFVSFGYKKIDDTLYTLTCDFSNIDTRYQEGDEAASFDSVISNTCYYTIRYRISDDSLNTTPDGSYDLLVNATDVAANESSFSTSVELDNTPEPVIILRPQPGDILKGEVIIDVTAPDDARFVCFWISPDGITWYDLQGTPDTCTIDWDGGNGWTQVWDTENDNLPDGVDYLVRVAAYDEMQPIAHLIAEDTLEGSVIVDNGPPILWMGILPTPVGPNRIVVDSLEGEVYVDEIILKGIQGDSISGVEKVIVEARNANGDPTNNSPILIPPKDSTFSRCLKLIEGNDYITVTVYDKAQNTCVDSALLTYLVPVVSVEVGAKGDTIAAPDGTTLIIPKGVLLHRTMITIKPVPDDELTACHDPGIKMLKVAHDFGPNGVVFHKPVKMILPYTDADLDIDQDTKPDYPEDSLAVFFFDGYEWLKVGEPDRNSTTNTVSIEINHFTIFDIGVDRRTIPKKAFVFLTRNPFKLREGTTISFTLPEPGKVSLKIYDLSGDVVATVTEEQSFRKGENSLKWDGRSDFGKYVGSGIYVYVLKYESESGKKDELIKKPIGVIK